MSTQTLIKQIFREYEKDRDMANYTYSTRIAEVRKKIKDFAAIDDKLAKASFEISRAVLTLEASEAKKLTEELKAQNLKLIEQKKQLLREYGYPQDYLTNIYKCSLCHDSGYDEDNRRCKCFSQRLVSLSVANSNLNDSFVYENFDTFDIRFYSEEIDDEEGVSPRANIEIIYKVCLDFVGNLDKRFTNLLFYGKPGLGKTFLCNSIAKEALESGKTVLYVTAPKLFKLIEEYRFNRDELAFPQELMESIYDIDLLIVDDLGTEFATIVTSSELFNIVNIRLLEKRPTVFSTNLSPYDFEGHYSERIVSRFFGSYRLLKFFGEDIRILKKYMKQ